MATWKEMSSENWTASRSLFNAGLWRSAITRSYYAVYDRATSALVSRPNPMRMPAGREGPSHAQLPDLVLKHLKVLEGTKRRELFSVISQLYYLRIQADYMPSQGISFGEAKEAHGLMIKAFKFLP
jgi:uncharacterized protein (UPF0332 family)